MTQQTLILPGLYDSGPEHWQSHWVRSDARCVRVEQEDWAAPKCADWVARLDVAVRGAPADVVLVAHSSSCAMVAHWATGAEASALEKVRGALLVAPSDPEGANYPAGPTGFGPVPMARLPFRSIVVASTDDEYVTHARAVSYATAWGSRLETLIGAGHINAAAGFGPWPRGRALLEELRGGEPLALPPYYHGTRADLRAGDLLAPGYMSNYGTGVAARWVYFAATLEASVWGAELAQGDGRERIYLVEPTGVFEHDPNVTNARFPGNPTKSYRTRDPLRITGEVTSWQGHTTEQVATMKAHVAALAAQGIVATEE